MANTPTSLYQQKVLPLLDPPPSSPILNYAAAVPVLVIVEGDSGKPARRISRLVGYEQQLKSSDVATPAAPAAPQIFNFTNTLTKRKRGRTRASTTVSPDK